MKPHIAYTFHHMGIPTDETRPGEIFSLAAGIYTTDNFGAFRIQ
ncbi:hypothetical protein [Sandaracinobacteroides sayramensis]|nr:hypothetical protein [Sandaracinobacteroides sayramensis]